MKRKRIRKILESYEFIISLAIVITLFLGFVVVKPWTKHVVNNLSSNLVYVSNRDTALQPYAIDTMQKLSDSYETGARGDVFGGSVGPLVAWIAAVITFLAFWAQYRANNNQRDDIRLERFESRFFKFIDYHRENVAQMKYADPKRKDENQKINKGNPVEFVEGNRVFRRIAEEVRELLIAYYNTNDIKQVLAKHVKGYVYYNSINTYLKNSLYHNNFIKTVDFSNVKKLHIIHVHHPIVLSCVIDFVFNCVFYGASKEAIEILKNKFPLEQFDFGSFRTKPAKYNSSVKYYGGHTRHLGHYFRNIYQTTKYVDEQIVLSEKQKYDYVTILRAQMSVYEQEVFFYNSLSDLGAVWELGRCKVYYPDNSKIKKKIFKRLWITKYDFIRNILNDEGKILIKAQRSTVNDVIINIKDYYPLLNLEREYELKQIGVLPFHSNDKKICRYCFNEKYIGYYQGNNNLENQLLKENINEKLKEAYPDGHNSIIDCDEELCATKKVLGIK